MGGRLAEQCARRDRARGRTRRRRARAVRRGGRNAARAGADRRPRQRRADERAAPLLPRRPRATPGHRARAPGRRGEAIDAVGHPALARLHPTGSHPERAERLQVLLDVVPVAEARAATIDEVARCHTAAYIEQLRAVEAPTWLDADTLASETSFEAALLAAGAAIEAAERGAFALVRPPGHHAL